MYQHVLSKILVPIFQVQLHSAREALAEAAVGKNLFGLEKRCKKNDDDDIVINSIFSAKKYYRWIMCSSIGFAIYGVQF